jgi:membrane protein YqaA with SNARE-associated domain
LAATVLPAQSEIVLAGMVLSERYQHWLLILVASTGNTLGSLVNWLPGRFIAHFEGRRWFPVKRPIIVGYSAIAYRVFWGKATDLRYY